MAKRTWWQRLCIKLFSPVPQDPEAVMFSRVDGALIPLRPVIDEDGVITDWVKDPDHSVVLNEERAAAAAAPPVLPPSSSAPAGFNPVGVPGL